MQAPGISRAVVMGVIGFMVGAFVVIVVRGLQSLTPLWDVGPGLVFASFFAAGFFVWGIGAFDPRLSVHGEEAHEEVHAEPEAEAEAKPVAMLSSMIWQISFLVLIGILLLAAFAILGPTLITTDEPAASVRDVGMLPVQIGNEEVPVSTLTVFAVFVLWTLLSLAVVGGLIALVMWWLSRGVVEGSAPAEALPPPRPYWAAQPGLGPFLLALVVTAGLFVILFLVFYYVAIGWVLPGLLGPLPFLLAYEPQLLFILSLVNAVVFTLLIMRPSVLVRLVSRIARWLARLLRARVYTNREYKLPRRDAK